MQGVGTKRSALSIHLSSLNMELIGGSVALHDL
jgi:hypothetical protein